MPPAPRADLLRLATLAACLLTGCFTELRLVVGRLDVPLADLLALGLALDLALDAALDRLRPAIGPLLLNPDGRASPPPALALPVLYPWLLALAAGLLSAALSGRGWLGAHAVIRGPLFCWLIYGAGVAGTIRRISAGTTIRLAALDAIWLSGLILPPAAWVIAHGYYGAVLELEGLVNNHKVPAVALAPLIGPMILWRPLIRDRWRFWHHIALALAVLAVLASFSRTAWITAAVGIAATIRWRGAPLIARPGIVLTGVAAAFAALLALPLVAGIRDMADSFDSRSSLNLRAWRMFLDSPWFGQGPGASTVWAMPPDLAARHARIDGVEAHGIVQKSLGELGLLGIAPMIAWASLSYAFWQIAAHAPTRRAQGAALLGLNLQLNLLLSTDFYSSAHWAPLALCLGLLGRPARQDKGPR